MNNPTQEQIAKLPQWAQQHIAMLERQRESAVTTLNAFQDADTPSSVYFEELPCTGEGGGPTAKRRYVQSNRIEIEHAGVYLSVHLARENDSQREYGIELNWSSGKRRSGSVCALVPKSFQSASIVAKENMR